MPTTTALEIPISTRSGLEIGTIAVEERTPGLVVGSFSAGPEYAAVERHFRYFEELVEAQTLSLTDQAAEAIDALGLMADVEGIAVPIRDVQIYSEGGASFRYAVSSNNGKHP